MFGIGEFVMVKSEVGLKVGKSPRVMVESGGEVVVVKTLNVMDKTVGA